MYYQVEPQPLSRTGKYLTAFILCGLLAMWGLAIYAYGNLPEKIPAHFGFNGEPTRYDSKISFLILPAAFSIAPIILLLLTWFRFTLFNKYPYLLNLPAFYANISKISEAKRAFWINRYFEVMLFLGAILTLSLFILEYGIYLASLSGKLPSWFLYFALSMPVWLIVPLILYFRKMSNDMKKDMVA